jgi:hypothetical protein
MNYTPLILALITSTCSHCFYFTQTSITHDHTRLILGLHLPPTPANLFPPQFSISFKLSDSSHTHTFTRSSFFHHSSFNPSSQPSIFLLDKVTGQPVPHEPYNGDVKKSP